MKKIAFALMLLAAPAFSGESLEKTTVTFGNGETYEFVPHGVTANGTVMLRVTSNSKPANIDAFDGGKVIPNLEPNELNCFEITYVKATDLMQCTRKSNCCSWSTEYYHGEGGALKLKKAATNYMDDPDTKKDEEKTVITYEAK